MTEFDSPSPSAGRVVVPRVAFYDPDTVATNDGRPDIDSPYNDRLPVTVGVIDCAIPGAANAVAKLHEAGVWWIVLRRQTIEAYLGYEGAVAELERLGYANHERMPSCWYPTRSVVAE